MKITKDDIINAILIIIVLYLGWVLNGEGNK